MRGVNIYRGSVFLNSGSIQNCDLGGVYVYDGSFTMNGGSITGNSSTATGSFDVNVSGTMNANGGTVGKIRNNGTITRTATGTNATHFSPYAPCTRAHAVTFLYRSAIAMGLDVSVGEDTNILSYNDAFDVPEYAIPAFQWACGMGIVTGNNGNLNPNTGCTRAQIVTFLYRLLAE